MSEGVSVEDAVNVDQVRGKIALGQNVEASEVLQTMVALYKRNPSTRVPMLGMLTLDGKPYSLKDHFPFEPLFKVKRPRRLVLKCARQVAKSTSTSADGVLSCASNPHLKMMFVTPRYEQIRRLSSNYVRRFINESMIKPLLVNESCTQHVLQRSFSNGSVMYFSFAFLDCDRIRGIAVDWINYDEFQDMDYDFLPIIRECMSASRVGPVEVFSGTPKTLDNGMEQVWKDSSKAEWVVPCHACGHWNMACGQADLLKMIGRKTVVCARCDKPINPREGHWYHTDGKEHPNFHGYHVPQVIMPMHYEEPEKWGELIDKRDGKGGCSKQKFMNEVLGESADFGIKLITLTDIRKASVLGENEYKVAIQKFMSCKVRVLGVDWGGGGQDEISYTTAALVGLNPITGNCECHYALRFHAGHTHDEEAKQLLKFFTETGCLFFAHDYGGSGSIRETLMIQAGLPIDRIMGFSYVHSTARDLVVYHPPARGEMRGYWALDKARSLVLQAICVKNLAVLLPEFESSKNVTQDLLALMEDKRELPAGADIYLIRRVPKQSDDFAHSLNFGCIAIWHTEQRYPDLSAIQGIKLSEAQLALASPPNPFRES